MGQLLSFGGQHGQSARSAKGPIQLISLVCSLVAILAILAPAVYSQTVCEKVIKDREKIQGIIVNGNDGFMFVDDRVFKFDVGTDFNAREHQLYVRSAGIHAEKCFDGVYLNGNKIFGVYMVKSAEETTQIHFIMAMEENDSDDDVEELDSQIKGFAYDLSRRQSLETMSSQVPAQYPFIYFSNNEFIVYMYQIPIYSFGLKVDDLPNRKRVSYFSFNALEGEMTYQQSPDLTGMTQKQKINAVYQMKLLLTSAFTYGDYVYLLTYDAVFVLKEKDMQSSAMPNFTKKSLSEFLQCSENAIMEGTNWTRIITIILSVILIVIIFVLIFAVTAPTKAPAKLADRPKSLASSHGPKSATSIGSTKSQASSSTTGK